MLVHLASREKGSSVELTFSARALPYGYGRNFGFNRVIKVVARPLWNIEAILAETGMLKNATAAESASDEVVCAYHQPSELSGLIF